MNLHLYVLTLLSVVTLSAGQKVGITSVVGFGCWNCASGWNYGCGEGDIMSVCRCENPAFLGTVLNCIHRYANGQEDINWGYTYVQSFCKHVSGREYSTKALDIIYRNATSSLLDPTHLTKDQLISGSVDVNESLFSKEFAAAKKAKQQYVWGTLFGVGMILYWALIILVATVWNLLNIRFPDSVDWIKEKSWWFRRYLSMPALFSKKHAESSRLLRFIPITFPTRAETLILTGYMVLTILSLAFGYHTYTPNPYLTTKTDQILRYLGNRTGIISFTQLPLMIVFAMRNSPLPYLTGWPYARFQIFHHWTARVMFAEALIHAVCFFWLSANQGIMKFRWQIHNWWFGNMALYASVIMLVISSHSIRTRFYEFFFLSHKLLFVVFTIGIYHHCIDFGWMPWIYSMIGLYCLELLLRLFRIVYCGCITYADFTLCEDDSTYRVRLNLGHTRRSPVLPGSFVRMRVLRWNLFWQAHPFTVFQVPSDLSKMHMLIKRKQGSTSVLSRYLAKQAKANAQAKPWTTVESDTSSGAMSRNPSSTCMSLDPSISTDKEKLSSESVIEAEPDTDSTSAACAKDVEGGLESVSSSLHINRPYCTNVRIPVIIEGPYGGVLPLKHYDHMLLMAGGIGVTATYSHALSVLPHVQHITFLWVLRTPEWLDWFSNEISSLFEAESSKLTMRVYVTCSDESTPYGQAQSCAIAKEKQPQIMCGRPDIANEVCRFMRTTTGRRAIYSCGPPSFVDDIRAAVTDNIDHSTVDYIEEAFTW